MEKEKQKTIEEIIDIPEGVEVSLNSALIILPDATFRFSLKSTSAENSLSFFFFSSNISLSSSDKLSDRNFPISSMSLSLSSLFIFLSPKTL